MIILRALGPKANMLLRGLFLAPFSLVCLVLVLNFITTFTCDPLFIADSSMDTVSNWTDSVTFSSIYCNSLNMSNTGSFNHKLKMYGITKLHTDIILMCDIRLSNSQNIPSSKQATLTLLTNPYGSYDFFAHSTRNKKGVGILIKKTSNFTVLGERRDAEENCLILHVRKTGTNLEFLVGSIYGPNRHKPAFFENLRNLLRNDNGLPIILGGDWNCTLSCEPARLNPDICNMNNLPNKRHSDLLNSLCDDLALADPYRTKFPNKNEYSYIPADPIKRNRSRLDFFIISRSILNIVTSTSILPGLQNKLFDHCAIVLEIAKKTPVITPPTISKKIL
jgi:exonuclease III